MNRSVIVRALGLVLLLGVGYALAAQAPPVKTFGQPHIKAVDGPAKVLQNVKVENYGRVIYEGPVDVNTTLERIREGRKYDHRNDGAFFGNRERRLPQKRDFDYYREFVHFMKNLPFPGPQRVVIGKGGEVYYTADHYESFERVR